LSICPTAVHVENRLICFFFKCSISGSVLFTKYYSSDQKNNEMFEGRVTRMGQRGSACRTLVGKPVGKRPLGRFRLRRDDDIKVNLQEVGWGRVLDISSSV
jgi:hypothetical protein